MVKYTALSIKLIKWIGSINIIPNLILGTRFHCTCIADLIGAQKMEPEEILREMQKLISAYNTSKELVATVPELKKQIAELEACKAALVEENKQFSADNKSKEEQIVTMKKELAEVRIQTAVVRRKNVISQKLAAIVPELKKKIADQEKRGEAWKAELVEANKQLVNSKLKSVEKGEGVAEY